MLAFGGAEWLACRPSPEDRPARSAPQVDTIERDRSTMGPLAPTLTARDHVRPRLAPSLRRRPFATRKTGSRSAPTRARRSAQHMADQVITCSDCGQDFVFTESEQAFYADRGFTTPRRCAACRAAKKAARGDSGGSYGGSSYGEAAARTAPPAAPARCSPRRAARVATRRASRSAPPAPSRSTAPTASAGANRTPFARRPPGLPGGRRDSHLAVAVIRLPGSPSRQLGGSLRSVLDEALRDHVAPPSTHDDDYVARLDPADKPGGSLLDRPRRGCRRAARDAAPRRRAPPRR